MSATKQPSKYKPIWNLLKQNKSCKITAPQKFHKTIIKMVRRTRDRDTEYLYNLAEENRINEIKTSINGTVITFTLTERLNLYGI